MNSISLIQRRAKGFAVTVVQIFSVTFPCIIHVNFSLICKKCKLLGEVDKIQIVFGFISYAGFFSKTNLT